MALTLKTRNQDSSCNVSIWILLLSNFLVYQLSSLSNESTDAFRTTDTLPSETSLENVLSPPKGKAVALPSVRIATDSLQSEQQYGGKGDKAHLGGFTDMDHHGISPAVWKWMVSYIGVHSVLDVGCGRGFSTSWFHFHGIDVLCVEGSHDAFENTVIPDTTRIVEHDFSRGPWWPEKTYDAVWCVEFLEHVGRNFQHNYLTAFRKSALIFASHSLWGGHHHVEVHNDEFWIEKMTMFGFIHSPGLTKKVREIAIGEKFTSIAPNGIKLNAQHVWLTMQVFINPAVAALPQHAHLMAEPGCFVPSSGGEIVHRECGTGNQPCAKLESVLPENFRALSLNPMHEKQWFEHVKPKVKQRNADEEMIDLGLVGKNKK